MCVKCSEEAKPQRQTGDEWWPRAGAGRGREGWEVVAKRSRASFLGHENVGLDSGDGQRLKTTDLYTSKVNYVGWELYLNKAVKKE